MRKNTTAKKKPARSKSPAKRKAASAETSEDPHFAAIVGSFAGDRRVTAGRMMSSLGLRVNGKIFAMMVRGRLVVKLPKARVDALLASGQGKPFDPRRDGRVMKEWVALTTRPKTWMAIAKDAYAFVGDGAK